MSDFVSIDVLPEIWEEILQRHWTFLETEESMHKLEERKKLEGCLKEFLCVAPHDRKFFLPETAHVLKKSISEMDDFTAFKAMNGFESISQYANNLFTKPWRKEYRVIKMYSGFYHHEVKSNLVDAEKLFIAMGYRQLPNKILVLEGPICPDQVTNVSRDAMTAFVECQIMKQIYTALSSLSITTSWLDIINYREKHTGGVTKTVKEISYALQEHRYRKDKLNNSENCYATIQHVSSPKGVLASSGTGATQMVSACLNCARSQYHHSTPAQITNGCSVHSNNNSIIGSQQQQSSCNIHHQQPSLYSTPTTNLLHQSYNGNKMPHAAHSHGPNYSHMSHSRSLEHYNDQHVAAGGGPPPLPHRHSFDQQQGCGVGHNLYDTPYDYVDGGSGSNVTYTGPPCNFNAYAHSYNVSRSRYPLPLKISNQLNAQYSYNGSVGNTALPSNNSGYPPQIISGCGHKLESLYADCNGFSIKQKQSLDSLPPCNYHHPRGTKDFQAYRQRSFPPDQLIDFEEYPMEGSIRGHGFHTRSQNNSFEYNDRAAVYDHRRVLASTSNRLNSLHPQTSSSYSGLPLSKDNMLCNRNHHYHHNTEQNSDELDGYATPMITRSMTRARANERNKLTDKYFKNSNEVMYDYDNAILIDNKKHQQQPQLPIESHHSHQQPQTQVNRQSSAMVNGVGIQNHNNSHGNHSIHQQIHPDSTYDNFEDFVNIDPIPTMNSSVVKSPSQANKNQDGVGSFESWDYVFQNLEKHGYSKDLGGRDDLFVQSLDLDSMNITGVSAEKRRSNRNVEVKSRQLNGESHQKSKTLEKTPTTLAATNTNVRLRGILEKPILKPQFENAIVSNHTTSIAPTASTSNTTKIIKSALKPAIATAVIDTNLTNNNSDERNSLKNATFSTTNSKTNRMNATASSGTGTIANKTTRLAPSAGATTQVIVSSPNEWSCRFCTFLNPNTKRICEMCCRSKDFNLEANNTPTCV